MNHTQSQLSAGLVVEGEPLRDSGTSGYISEWFIRDNLAAFDGRVIFFKGPGDSGWKYGLVHFRDENTFVNIAANYAEREEHSHSAIYPFQLQERPGFVFRAAAFEEYKGLCFSREEFSVASKSPDSSLSDSLD
jgi:hypothetical protein